MTERPTAHRATGEDVARRAGVSRATVSLILNGRGDRFPEATRQRVHEAAAALQYRVSRAGRELRSGRSDLVVVLVPNATFGRNLQDSVERLAVDAAPHGFTVLVRFTGRDLDAAVEAVSELRPAAVLDMGVLRVADRERLEAEGVGLLDSGLGWSPDRAIGAALATELLRAAPRRLVWAALHDERPDHPYGPARRAGMAEEAARRGVPAPLAIAVPLRVDGAADALRAAVADGLPIGVGCYNDDVALALLAAARELGLRVPQDVALVGVDHSDLGRLSAPPLTTVAIDLDAVTDHTFRRLIEPETTAPAPSPEQVITVVAGGTTLATPTAATG